MNATLEHTDSFANQAISSTYGSWPRVSFNRNERLIPGTPLYFSLGGEYASLLRSGKNTDDPVQDYSQDVTRLDVNPQIRFPFKKWQWFTVNSTVNWRDTYYSRSYAPTGDPNIRPHDIVDVPLWLAEALPTAYPSRSIEGAWSLKEGAAGEAEGTWDVTTPGGRAHTDIYTFDAQQSDWFEMRLVDVSASSFSPLLELYNPSTDTNNFGPRLGFAYRIPGKHDTVLRGGGGLFFGPTVSNTIGDVASLGFSTSASFTFQTSSVKAASSPSRPPTCLSRVDLCFRMRSRSRRRASRKASSGRTRSSTARSSSSRAGRCSRPSSPSATRRPSWAE
jgi:hypothetical protein